MTSEEKAIKAGNVKVDLLGSVGVTFGPVGDDSPVLGVKYLCLACDEVLVGKLEEQGLSCDVCTYEVNLDEALILLERAQKCLKLQIDDLRLKKDGPWYWGKMFGMKPPKDR